MAEKVEIHDLTLWDRVSVILYRAGIVLTALLLTAGGILWLISYNTSGWSQLQILNERGVLTYLTLLYLSTGVSVVTIHLYAKRFRKMIRLLYLLAIAGFALIIVLSGGKAGSFVLKNPLGGFLLLPLAGSIGFITMKEAFCFRLYEGYMLAILLPLLVFFLVIKVITPPLMGAFLVFIGIIMCYFCWRKVKIPLAYDIGDKSAYET